MRTKLVGLTIVVSMILPLTSLAQGASQGATMRALLQQITALQQQLSQLQGQGQTGSGSGSGSGGSTNFPIPSIPPEPIDDEPPTPLITFERNLYLGLRNDPDVSNLQEFLTDQGFYNQTISGNFFILTRNAVRKFQQAHGIRPSGYFDPATRAIANKILAGEETVSPRIPPPFPVRGSLSLLTLPLPNSR